MFPGPPLRSLNEETEALISGQNSQPTPRQMKPPQMKQVQAKPTETIPEMTLPQSSQMNMMPRMPRMEDDNSSGCTIS